MRLLLSGSFRMFCSAGQNVRRARTKSPGESARQIREQSLADGESSFFRKEQKKKNRI
jgi:hypothetical protein